MEIMQCSINIESNIVYARTSVPFVIMMLNGTDGSIMLSKVIYCSGSYCSDPSMLQISNIMYIPVADKMIVYYMDSSKNDYVISTSA